MAEINQLDNEIIEEARKMAQTILERAEEEAANIINNQKLEVQRITQTALDHRNKLEEQEIQREISRVRIRNQIELNNLQNELLEKVIKESQDHIEELYRKKDQLYRSALFNLIKQGVIALEGGNMTVEVSEDDITLINTEQLESESSKLTKNEIKIKIIQNESIKGGAIIHKENMTVYNTIDAIFDRRRNTIRNKLNKILFSK